MLTFGKKKKSNKEVSDKSCTAKMKEFSFPRSYTERLPHRLIGIKVPGVKSFLLKLYMIYFSNAMNANKI